MNINDYQKQWNYLSVKKNLSGAEALEAVKQNGDALRYVPEAMLTEAIALEAVKQDGYALQYVPEAMFRDKIE